MGIEQLQKVALTCEMFDEYMKIYRLWWKCRKFRSGRGFLSCFNYLKLWEIQNLNEDVCVVTVDTVKRCQILNSALRICSTSTFFCYWPHPLNNWTSQEVKNRYLYWTTLLLEINRFAFIDFIFPPGVKDHHYHVISKSRIWFQTTE